MNDESSPEWFFQICDALGYVLGFFRRGRRQDG
jgi:hypothetical protein